jgi:hypothetical protein
VEIVTDLAGEREIVAGCRSVVGLRGDADRNRPVGVEAEPDGGADEIAPPIGVAIAGIEAQRSAVLLVAAAEREAWKACFILINATTRRRSCTSQPSAVFIHDFPTPMDSCTVRLDQQRETGCDKLATFSQIHAVSACRRRWNRFSFDP